MNVNVHRQSLRHLSPRIKTPWHTLHWRNLQPCWPHHATSRMRLRRIHQEIGHSSIGLVWRIRWHLSGDTMWEDNETLVAAVEDQFDRAREPTLAGFIPAILCCWSKTVLISSSCRPCIYLSALWQWLQSSRKTAHHRKKIVDKWLPSSFLLPDLAGAATAIPHFICLQSILV